MNMHGSTATITFHAPTNMGAFLQAYALQNAIQSLGYDNRIINYRSVAQKQHYRMLKVPISARTIVQDYYVLRHLRSFILREMRFSQLRKNHLHQTIECSDLKSVQTVAKDYSVLICGSDQIWNKNLPDADDVYYIPGVNNKISYGVSFGNQCSADSLNELQKYIHEFKALSFREISGVREVRAALGIKAKQVIDPTFFLSKDDWNTFSGNSSSVKGDYIFFYSIRYPDDALRIAAAISERLRLPVISPFGGLRAYAGRRAERYGIKVDYSSGPKEFLGYLRGASLALSDSYHGTVFPIIYQKPFYQIRHLHPDGHYISNERIDSLLEQMDLADRTVDIKSIDSMNPGKSINWIDVDRRIEQLKDESLNWLRGSIQSVDSD